MGASVFIIDPAATTIRSVGGNEAVNESRRAHDVVHPPAIRSSAVIADGTVGEEKVRLLNWIFPLKVTCRVPNAAAFISFVAGDGAVGERGAGGAFIGPVTPI